MHSFDFRVYRVTFAGKLCLTLGKPFLFQVLRIEANQQWSNLTRFRIIIIIIIIRDVLSAAPSARTPGSHARREHHFLVGVVSAADD